MGCKRSDRSIGRTVVASGVADNDRIPGRSRSGATIHLTSRTRELANSQPAPADGCRPPGQPWRPAPARTRPTTRSRLECARLTGEPAPGTALKAAEDPTAFDTAVEAMLDQAGCCRLAHLRKRCRLTQADIATLADVSAARISQIENGGDVSTRDVAQRHVTALEGTTLKLFAALAEPTNPGSPERQRSPRAKGHHGFDSRVFDCGLQEMWAHSVTVTWVLIPGSAHCLDPHDGHVARSLA
jgi:transcriptional regulator with XRE-family HTH domain